MAMLPILQHPDPRLRITGAVVDKFENDTQKIIDDMIETLNNTANCLALAAVQLGVPLRITVINMEHFEKEFGGNQKVFCLVNPVITPLSGTTCTREGCMSVGGLTTAAVTRCDKIRVNAQDRYGESITFEANGYYSKCIQHETDHLHGKLYLDYLSTFRRKMIERRVAKAQARSK